jgi:hypothetical protein
MSGLSIVQFYMHKFTLTLCLLLIVFITLSQSAIASGISMIDFTKAFEHQNWLVTNDNVMGGLSKGRLTYDGQLSQFAGELSLENNGGFSSVNRSVESIDHDVDSVELTIVGDGRSYQLRFTTLKNNYRINYKHEFSTQKGLQQKIIFYLNDFQAVFRGRLIDGAPKLIAADIKQVGLLIADKKPLPFELSLIQLEFKSSSRF